MKVDWRGQSTFTLLSYLLLVFPPHSRYITTQHTPLTGYTR
ncbi:hypothetical protein Krac_8767 [Ktedonobacter racemifer DSM 44963]|uniref:Uncharacterized protein n=1 Tax=Ktedonobacter racemifer DSM 44963 TaxID=485913 RepID=D6TP79_KTERA|nr:hypothetical protein Krac_8767 [Ktedonobacter racemifer DSM 44963]